MSMIASPPTRPQPRPSPNPAFISLPDPAASRRAWASLLASRLRREAEVVAADAEREIDAWLVRKIEVARQRLLAASTRAERTMASNAMRLLSAARISDQTRPEGGGRA
ncbi:MAG TPA: hypothetical protein VFX20_15505 [Steroidobacteraceae bacterium]|nr:hypothetical protein [Steroidobacteraceae bacterium]